MESFDVYIEVEKLAKRPRQLRVIANNENNSTKIKKIVQTWLDQRNYNQIKMRVETQAMPPEWIIRARLEAALYKLTQDSKSQ